MEQNHADKSLIPFKSIQELIELLQKAYVLIGLDCI